MEKYKTYFSPCSYQKNMDANLDVVEEVFSRVSIKDVLNIAYLFAPNFLLIKDYVFVEDFFNRWGGATHSYDEHIRKIEELEKQFHGDSVKIEQMINSWSIVDLFCSQNAESPLSDEDIEAFCRVLVYCWKLRLKDLFPDQNIIVESGYEIMGELGLTITVYHAR